MVAEYPERPSFYYPARWLDGAYLSVPDGLVQHGENGWLTLQKYPFSFTNTQHFRCREHARHVTQRLQQPIPLWTNSLRINGSWILGISKYASSFYHLVSDLVFTALSEQADQILLPQGFPPLFQEMLIRSGLKILELPRGTYVVERLLLPESRYPEWTPHKVAVLRNFFAPLIDSASGAQPRRIYVSRSLATRRRLINEEQCRLLFQRYGVEIIHLEQMTLTEQVTTCAHAEWLLGPHGAGLIYLLLTDPSTCFLEIRPIPTSGDFCFTHLAACGWAHAEVLIAPRVDRFEARLDILEEIFQRWEKLR
jgi:Glycosyltransferase 61